MIRGTFHRWLMKTTHRYGWHHMSVLHPKPSYHEGGDTLYWCKWCGIRDVVPTNPIEVIRKASKDG